MNGPALAGELLSVERLYDQSNRWYERLLPNLRRMTLSLRQNRPKTLPQRNLLVQHRTMFCWAVVTHCGLLPPILATLFAFGPTIPM